jgi:hypothetical protein
MHFLISASDLRSFSSSAKIKNGHSEFWNIFDFLKRPPFESAALFDFGGSIFYSFQRKAENVVNRSDLTSSFGERGPITNRAALTVIYQWPLPRIWAEPFGVLPSGRGARRQDSQGRQGS